MVDKEKEFEELLHKKRMFLVSVALTKKSSEQIDKLIYKTEKRVRDLPDLKN